MGQELRRPQTARGLARLTAGAELALGAALSWAASAAMGLSVWWLWPALPLALGAFCRVCAQMDMAIRARAESAQTDQPWPKLTLPQAARYYAFNLWAMVRCQWALFPWSSKRKRQARLSGRPLVLLAHGYICDESVFRALERRLDAEGFDCDYVRIEPIFGCLSDFSRQFGEQAQRALDRSGQPHCLVVAHSMGGIVARRWILDGGAPKVSGLLTIASPHHGTLRSGGGPGPCAAEMAQGSPFLSELNARWSEARNLPKAASVWTAHDNIVSPSDSAILPGAKNVAVEGVGHLSMLFHPKALDAIVGELKALSASR